VDELGRGAGDLVDEDPDDQQITVNTALSSWA